MKTEQWIKELGEMENDIQTLGLNAELIAEWTKIYWQRLDTFIHENHNGIVCHEGCNACCQHYPSSNESFELLTIYGHLRQKPNFAELILACWEHSKIFEQLLTKNLRSMSFVPAEDLALGEYFLQGRYCPFANSKGQCEIYAIRPSSCRLYLSRQKPELCEGEGLGHEDNGNYLLELPDSVEEAIHQIAHQFDALQIPEYLFSALVTLNSMEDEFRKTKFYNNVE